MPPGKLTSLSIFFPCFNDDLSIKKLVAEAFNLAPEIATDYEILVIDDGSCANTKNTLDELKITYPTLRVITHANNQGYGSALASGISKSAKDFIFYTDGDGQYSLNDIKKLIPLMTQDISAVNGYKTIRHDSKVRIYLGNLFNSIIRRTLGIKLKDVDCDFRLFRRNVIQSITLELKSGAVCTELVKKIEAKGFKFSECPVSHYSRKDGKSQFFKPLSLLKMFRDITILHYKVFTGNL